MEVATNTADNASLIDSIIETSDLNRFKEYILSGKYNIESDLSNNDNNKPSLLLCRLFKIGWYNSIETYITHSAQ